MPFVVQGYAEFLDYAGVEAADIPARHFGLLEYWTENFAGRSAGSLVGLPSVGYKVLVWRSSDQNADLRGRLCLEPVAAHWELVQDDTGLGLLNLELQSQQDSFVMGQQGLQQYAAEREQNILMQRHSVVELTSHSSDKSVGLLKKSLKNSLLLAVAVCDLVTGSFVAQLMVSYFLYFVEFVAYLLEHN